MFALKSRCLRRRLSAPTSGSARRRARERRQAERTRAEGEKLAREKKEQRLRDKLEQQRQAREELASYEPWGRAGGGAPNSLGVRYSDLRANGIYPEDELKGVSQFEDGRRRRSPGRRGRRRTPRLREDPQLCYADGLRQAVDNDIRYRQTPDQQKTYKQILDDLVDIKRRAVRKEHKRDLEYERKMHTMGDPWGKPGPGGTTWRNPRNIGLNFSKSMGWTDNEIFNKMKGDHKRRKSSLLTLPKVKKDDDAPDKENVKPSSVEKLPKINVKPQTNSENVDKARIGCNEDSSSDCKKDKKKKKNNKFVKRLSNRDSVTRIVPNIETNDDDLSYMTDKKLTPEETIIRLTGGVELVPLFARRRQIGARTLPSSDVTRPPDQDCQWRQVTNDDYLRHLKQQMRVKCEQIEESRRDSAESCLRHHATWASLWGRPGHGAPQRGRNERHNLSRILYVPPLLPPPRPLAAAV